MELAIASAGDARLPVTIRRLTAEGIPWRVRAEVWPEDRGYAGRLMFEPESPRRILLPREGPAVLRGSTEADVLLEAHSFSESRLRALLHSLA